MEQDISQGVRAGESPGHPVFPAKADKLATISVKKKESECYLQMLPGIVKDHEAWLFSEVLSGTRGTRHMLQHGHLPSGRKEKDCPQEDVFPESMGVSVFPMISNLDSIWLNVIPLL